MQAVAVEIAGKQAEETKQGVWRERIGNVQVNATIYRHLIIAISCRPMANFGDKSMLESMFEMIIAMNGVIHARTCVHMEVSCHH